jgi:hypothetical protein
MEHQPHYIGCHKRKGKEDDFTEKRTMAHIDLVLLELLMGETPALIYNAAYYNSNSVYCNIHFAIFSVNIPVPGRV